MSKIHRPNSSGSDGHETSTTLPQPSSPDPYLPSPRHPRFLAASHRGLARDPMTFAALAATTGILAAHQHPPFFALALFLLPLLFPWRPSLRPFAWLLFVALFFAALHRIQSLPSERLPLLLRQADASSLPVHFSGLVQDRLAPGEFRFLLTSLTQSGQTLATHNQVRLQIPSRRVLPGMRLSGSGRISRPPAPRNPGERPSGPPFQAHLAVASFQQLSLEPSTPGQRAQSFASDCRDWIAKSITRGVPPDSEAAGLIQAMVLGLRDTTSPSTQDSFRRSGAMHLFSVSGLHVAIFASVIWWLLRPFPVSRLTTVLLIAGAASFYAFVTGLPASAVRAALMLSVVLFGFALRRQARLLNSLGLAALLILLADTRQIFDIGFQLSFSVMAAIALLCPAFERLFQRFTAPDPFLPASLHSPRWRRWEDARRGVTSLLSLSLAAWIGSLPLTLWYFGLLTPLSVLANCVLVPASWLVMAGATASLGLTLLHIPWLPAIVNQLNAACAGLLLALASFFAHLPGAAVQWTPLSRIRPGAPPSQPSLIVFDLRQSCAPQALLLPRAPNQAAPPVWLIDPGDYASYSRSVRPWLRRQRLRSLEGLILTHGDSQHVNAAPACSREFPVRQLLFSPLGGRSKVWNQMHQQPLSPGQTRLDLTAGSRLELAPGVALQAVFPPPGYPDQAQADDECLVFLIEWLGWRILSLADSGFNTEKWLLENQPGLRCDVVIRSRHRQDPCCLPELLRQIRPACLISTNHSFPAAERLPEGLHTQLASLGIVLFDQARTGAVTLTPSSNQLRIEPCCEGKTMVLRRDTLGLQEN